MYQLAIPFYRFLVEYECVESQEQDNAYTRIYTTTRVAAFPSWSLPKETDTHAYSASMRVCVVWIP